MSGVVQTNTSEDWDIFWGQGPEQLLHCHDLVGDLKLACGVVYVEALNDLCLQFGVFSGVSEIKVIIR